jgi:hypothetical protein
MAGLITCSLGQCKVSSAKCKVRSSPGQGCLPLSASLPPAPGASLADDVALFTLHGVCRARTSASAPGTAPRSELAALRLSLDGYNNLMPKGGLMANHPTPLGGTCDARFEPLRELFAAKLDPKQA